MAKDLEKVNEKLEKQNRKLKKKNSAGGKIILFLLLIILIFAAIVFFLDPFGWGFNFNTLTGGKTSGSEQPQAQTSAAVTSTESEAAAATEETEPYVAIISVTVSDNKYLLDNAEATADKIVANATALDSDVIVEITDDNATKNAMDALTSALESAQIAYTIK